MGDGLIQKAIERPVSVLVGALLILLFGALSIVGIPIQLTPDIVVPTVAVTTAWPGAAPTEIEAEILEEQEEALKDLPGLVRMESTAESDSANVNLEFQVGTSIEEALVRVTNRLAQIGDYPESSRPPVISTANASGPPLAVVLIQSKTGGSMAEYRTWVEKSVMPPLERIRGVAEIRLIGGRDREIEVAFDVRALAARQIPLSEVAKKIQGELRDISGGDVSLGKRRFLVRTALAPDSPVDLESLVLRTSDEGSPILLGDVAKVRHGLRKPRALAYADGMPSLAMLFFREPGFNVLQVTEDVRKTVLALQEKRMAPEGLQIRLVFDQTGYINGALNRVTENLVVGGLLAMVVLLLFLRSFGASALISISIPICVIGTALGMALMGRTINIVSLAGMAFAVGMVVDNAIVVLENIHTWRANGAPPKEAALKGTQEVLGAILASTITTAAVFIPVIGWQDEVGELLRDVAVAISVAVFVSLVVSVFAISSFSAKLRQKPVSAGGAKEGLGSRLRSKVAAQARWISTSWARSLVVVVAALGGAAAVVMTLLPPMEYLPTGNRNLIFGIIVPPPGYAIEELARIGETVQRQIVAHTGVERDGVPAIARSFFVATPQRAFMGASAEKPERIEEVRKFVGRVQKDIPGVFGVATQASLFGRRIDGGRGIEVEISGPDLKALVDVGKQLMGAIREVIPAAQIRPIPSLDLGAPEIRVRPNRQQLASSKMSGAELGLAVDALIDGTIIGELSRHGEPKLNVVLRAAQGAAHTPEALASAAVATPANTVVPLGTLAVIDEVLGPVVIQRIEGRRSITLMVSPPRSVALESAMARIRDDVVGKARAAGKLPNSVRIELSGTAGKLDAAKARMVEVLILAVIISLLLMAALFEDFLAPLAILVTVPLAAAGGVIGLRLVDRFIAPQALDMMTALGFLILVGVVVNNAILVVDGALARLRDGSKLAEALGESVARRVRPILMSTLTSLAGLLPLVIMPGSGSELYRGVGSVVLGGLALSTVLTLYVVPAAFSLLWRLRGVS